jgi:hypothetical protein
MARRFGTGSNLCHGNWATRKQGNKEVARVI